MPKINPTETNAWRKLYTSYRSFQGTQIKDLFGADSDRFQNYSLKFGDILVDYSKNLIDNNVRELLIGLAGECGLKEAIGSMFSGQKINATEN